MSVQNYRSLREIMSLFQSRICRVGHSARCVFHPVFLFSGFFFLVYNKQLPISVFSIAFCLGSVPAHSILTILASVKYLTHYSFSPVFADCSYVPTLSFFSPNSLMLLTHMCYPVELSDPFLKKQLTDFFSTFN